MTSRFYELLPNPWPPESVLTKAPLLTLLIWLGTSAMERINLLPRDEAALISGVIALLILYWIPPLPRERYVRWIGSHFLLLVGAYVCLFKLPLLFAGFVGYRVMSFILISLYAIGMWFFISRKKSLDDH